MGDVVVDITVSLDGYVTAPGAGPSLGLGVDGDALHRWAITPTPEDQAILDASVARTGAVLMGRRTFDVVDGPHGWSGDLGYGARRDQSSPPPVFVLTSTQPDSIRLTDRMNIVTGGTLEALARAQEAAGERDVFAMGGGELCRRLLAEGVVDRLCLHIAPLVLGAGTPLWGPMGRFELEQESQVVTDTATHLTYRVRPRGLSSTV